MRIILEGCDGTGKTTLAKVLADRYHLDICHCTSEDPKDFDFYKQTARKENVIWDRHTIGELIYPEIFNRKPQISPEDARIILGIAREHDGKVIILTAEDEIIHQRLSARNVPEDSRIMENISHINEQFKFFAEYFNVHLIDTSKTTLEEIFYVVEQKENFRFIHY